jgi:GAF domain-containing protein
MTANYALYKEDGYEEKYELGVGLVGQVAKNGKIIKLDTIPENYLPAVSGLGRSDVAYLLLIPIVNTENENLGVLELASFKDFYEYEMNFLQEVALLLAKEIGRINAY